MYVQNAGSRLGRAGERNLAVWHAADVHTYTHTHIDTYIHSHVVRHAIRGTSTYIRQAGRRYPPRTECGPEKVSAAVVGETFARGWWWWPGGVGYLMLMGADASFGRWRRFSLIG